MRFLAAPHSMLVNNPCLLLSFVLHRTLWLKRFWLLFQSRVRHFFCKTLQSYNSPAARARELFKPSTDLACLLVEIEKKFFQSGDTCGRRHKWGCFCVYLVTFTQPWAPIRWPMFWLCFWKLDQNPRPRALEWLSSISGAQIMNKKNKNWWKCLHPQTL